MNVLNPCNLTRVFSYMNVQTRTMKTLKEITQFLNTISHIEDGGCGIAALATYRWLVKNNKHKGVKIVYLYEDDSEECANINCEVIASKNPRRQPVCPCHVALLRNGRFIDNKGFRSEADIFDGYIEYHEVTTEFLIKTLNRVRIWNDSFNRKKGIAILQQALEVDLSDIKL